MNLWFLELLPHINFAYFGKAHTRWKISSHKLLIQKIENSFRGFVRHGLWKNHMAISDFLGPLQFLKRFHPLRKLTKMMQRARVRRVSLLSHKYFGCQQHYLKMFTLDRTNFGAPNLMPQDERCGKSVNLWPPSHYNLWRQSLEIYFY